MDLADPFNELCRICLQKNNFLVPIFERWKFLTGIIFNCTRIKIEFSTELPSNICKKCILNLDTAYKFKKLCEKTEGLLKEFLANKNSMRIDNESNPEQCKQVEDVHENDFESSIENNEVSDTDGNEFRQEKAVETEPRVEMGSQDLFNSKSSVDPLSIDLSPVPETKSRKNKKEKYRKYTCEICGLSFKTFTHLKGHFNIHTDIKPFKCDRCSKSFKIKHNYKLHLRKHTGDIVYYNCEICPKQYATKRGFLQHKQSHSGIKPYKCDFCDKSFALKARLVQHIILHRNERKHKCNLCSSAFNLRAQLKRHLLSHSEAKPFVCAVCNKSFRHKRNLNIHIKIHTGEKPYKCEICSKSYRYNILLKNHLRSQHDVTVPTKSNIADAEK